MKVRQIAVMSGKGGAGKTSFTAALARLYPQLVAVDADVNASNLPILLQTSRIREADFFGMDVARIDPDICDGCDSCRRICAFDAIDIDAQGHHAINDGCEGCYACAWVCPRKAITMVPHKAGERYVSTLPNGFLVHADLVPGEDNSGKLIAVIREEALALAREQGIGTILIDGPPGTSCQAISSLTGVQLVVAVLEESLSGLSDYNRLASLVGQFRLPHIVVINKAGRDRAFNTRFREAIDRHEGRLVATIPFDSDIPRSLSRGETLLEMPVYRPIVEAVYGELTGSNSL